MTQAQLIWFVAVVTVGFLVPYLQARRLAALGSDHAVHVFLINVIRENRFRLFETVPRIVNPSYCGAYPLFLHWVLALAGPNVIPLASLTLNAALNAVVVSMTFLVMSAVTREDPAQAALVGPAALALALLPQFYHALSARNFGISARPLGLVLFAATGFLAYAGSGGAQWPLAAGAVIAYAIWGSSTFGLQMVVFSGAVMGGVFGEWGLLTMAAGGGVLFVVLHRGYALSYIRHTVLFSVTYARELAPLFILQRRVSIWRDLVWDIGARLRHEPVLHALRYAYKTRWSSLWR